MPKVMPNGASGHGGGGGRRRRPRVSSALSEINVVPLVDVMLVLLIIFMVAAPMMQQGLAVNLPQQKKAQAMPADSQPIYVTVPTAFARNRLVQLGNESINLSVLTERIRQRLERREDKQVFLRSDGQVTMQQVMDVMDRLKAGGVEKVGIVSRPATDTR
jgi:biopolymer transport protein ExbD